MSNNDQQQPTDASEYVQQLQEAANRYAVSMREDQRFGPFQKKSRKLVELKLECKSLVFDEVASEHAKVIERRFLEFMQQHKTKPNSLRFVTLLDSVMPMNESLILSRLSEIDTALKLIQKNLPDVHVFGAYEFELVNFEFINNHASMTGHSPKPDSQNKIDVLRMLGAEQTTNGSLEVFKQATGTKVLVHIHALVDFGTDADNNISKFKSAVVQRPCWSMHPTQLHIESLFSTKSLSENIRILCEYMTKSGNEQLMYKLFYGRDKDQMTVDELDAAIYRSPFDSTGMTRYEQIRQRKLIADDLHDSNPRSLTHREVRFLNDLTYKVMIRNQPRLKLGYLVEL